MEMTKIGKAYRTIGTKKCIEVDKRYETIRKLEKKIENLRNNRIYDTETHLLIPFVQTLLPAINVKYKGIADKWEFMGPFGLNCEYGIRIFIKSNNRTKTFYLSVHTGIDKDNSPYVQVVNHHKKTNRFPEGSIGAMNGGNYEIRLVDDLSPIQIIRMGGLV